MSRRRVWIFLSYRSKAGSFITKHAVQTVRNRASKAAPPLLEPLSEFRLLEQESTQPDVRSPLQRFRSKPKKTLSVTDLVSPSWCELQYWYSLTKHGKKRLTSAMRQGSAVHKVLEDQVHRIVEVNVQKKEDSWGLRLWNIVQGLRGLRETGLTRELEIWGIIDGEVINGVIDEVSFRCPNEMEGSATAAAASNVDRQVYLTDVKTRGTRKLPSGASFRPTAMQLMLYHVLLSDLATNRVDADVVFNRYGLEPDQDFSDAFRASLTNLCELSYDNSFEPIQSEQSAFAQEFPPLILNHKTLRQLWALMVREFQETLPLGVKSIGRILRAEYRDQGDGAVLGEKTFLFDRDEIGQYLQHEMKWWKGERVVQGVCIEEAYKCRICEFADDCEWRKKKVDEATEAYRKRSCSTAQREDV